MLEMHNTYINELKRLKYKITPARVKIIMLLSSFDKPLTVEMMCEKIGDKSINQTTVYRTVEFLLKLRLIGRVDLRGDAVYYELLDRHHHHIVCTSCGALEDFESCKIESVAKNILSKSKKFKSIDDHSFELFGICKLCV